MRRALLVLIVVLLGRAIPAHAAPITVSAGETVTFNFDFVTPGLIPPPALGISFYSGVDVPGALQPGNFGLWRGYSELNGAGALIYGPFNAILLSTVLQQGAVDGVFSMALSVVTGSITVDPIAHVWLNNSVQGPGPVAGVPVAGAVPEPAMLALLGAGLAGAAWRRRRGSVAGRSI
jgi:PEP-CTERM motif